ncbi:Kelch repeat-containing protein [Adhaeribacter aquaticus]|uniref:Kelch repeat-containing protein n=1 Tax=Adhaeribacter aquaticus TaxID=299567 RepID=UPI0004103FF1|nr:kelch repeat-containing protein [Adhaeribacter aquaticus]
MKKSLLLSGALIIPALFLFNFSRKKEPLTWKPVVTATSCEARHESAFARVGDKFVLLGGRKIKAVNIFDAVKKEWTNGAMPPLEMNHFQAVEYKGEVYVIGAFTGSFPHEKPIPTIYIYNPKTDKWREGPVIPADRQRGAAGAVVHNNKIYLVCGITDGHYDGHVAWFDEFDPATGKWRKLPDAPHVRDHVSVGVAENQLVIAGGRRSYFKIGDTMTLTTPEVDVFNFKTNKWETMPAAQNIPTQRAGNTAAVLGSKVIIIGGESIQELAHNETEAFDVKTRTWEKLTPLNTGRHGTGAVVYKGKVFIAAGSAKHGGGPEINSMEVLE